jgi:hypothetical protein
MRAALILFVLTLVGCAHSVHQVHTSDFLPGAPIESGEMVKGSAEQFVILGFASETNYVNQAYQRLMGACPDGAITGITTQYTTALGFFSWRNKVLMQGLCLKKAKS